MTIYEYAGTQIEMPDGMTPEQIKNALANFRKTPDFMMLVDQKSGAPASVRMRVGNANPQDRLANIQQYYPDAIPHGDDNFIFTDPVSKKPTLYNPKGMDLGDVVSEGKSITMGVASSLGAAAGGALGALAGPGAPVTVPQGAIIGAGVGNTIGAQLWDLIDYFNGPPVIDTRTTAEKMMSPVVDFATGAIGQKVGDVIGAGVKRAFSGPSENVAEVVKAASRVGIEPRASMVGSRMVASAEAGLATMPAATDVVGTAADKTLAQINKAVDDTAERLLNIGTEAAADQAEIKTVQGAGEVIQGAAKKAAKRFKAQQKETYETVFQMIGADTPVPMANTQALLREMEAELASAPMSKAEFLGGAIARMRAIMSDSAERRMVITDPLDPTGRTVITTQVTRHEGYPFSDLRQTRTMIGKELDDPQSFGSTGAQNAAKRRIYHAMTLDMSAAARSVNPEAARLLAAADANTKEVMNSVAHTMNKIEKFQAADGAYIYALEGSKNGGMRLTQLRDNFTSEEWDVVASTVLSRLARNPRGEFSIPYFLKRWDGGDTTGALSPEAKKALFGGTRYAELRSALDDLVTVMRSADAVAALSNTSNTARALGVQGLAAAWGGILGGAGGALLGGVGGMTGGALMTALATQVVTTLGSRKAAKLITSPAFVRWLASPPGAGGWPAHISRLYAVVEADPSIKEEVHQFLMALRSTPEPQPQQQR